MASITYGEARFTNDVDIVADLQVEHVQPLCCVFAAPDYYCSQPAVEEAVIRRSQFNVIHPASGLKIDFMVPEDTAFNRERLARGTLIQIDDAGHQARFASPEDVILKKLEYYLEGGSDKHLRDIRGVLVVQGEAIDFAYLQLWAKQLGVEAQLRLVLSDH